MFTKIFSFLLLLFRLTERRRQRLAGQQLIKRQQGKALPFFDTRPKTGKELAHLQNVLTGINYAENKKPSGFERTWLVSGSRRAEQRFQSECLIGNRTGVRHTSQLKQRDLLSQKLGVVGVLDEPRHCRLQCGCWLKIRAQRAY